jgi:hypothetical protein
MMENLMVMLHVWRVALAELLLWLVVVIMPRGPEKAMMENCVYQYVIWVKENS